jgi:hypothetical protein
MDTRIDDLGFVECTSDLERIADVMDLIAACIELRSRGLLIESDRLPAAFFDLRTGFAGDLVQKFQNYGVKVAAVIGSSQEHGERFEDFLREARRGPQFRVFNERAQAETWLSHRP